MKKLSAEDVREVMGVVPEVLRKLAAERDLYRDRLQEIEGRQRVEKLASAMLDKGLETGTASGLADRLEKQARSGELDLTRLADAVELVGPDMGKTAQLSDDLGHAGGATELERFILS